MNVGHNKGYVNAMHVCTEFIKFVDHPIFVILKVVQRVKTSQAHGVILDPLKDSEDTVATR